MDDLTALITGLDGLSLFVGLVIGLLVGVGFVMLTRFSMKKTFQRALDDQQTTFEGATKELKAAFDSLSSEALKSNQESFFNLANDKFDNQTERHSSELESKKS